ncbi:MAG: hypothetical protein WD356_01630 [Pseudomonadales bacterium]
MQCNDARQQLDKLARPGDPGADDALAAHLRECDDCRDYAREQQLIDLLASMPIRPPAPGFEERVMENALAGKSRETGRTPAQRGTHVRWFMATAASVLLAVILTMQFNPGEDGDQVVSVKVRPGVTQMVTVRLTSPTELANALLTLQLDENLELEGRAGVHEMQWRTTLKSGPNDLSLPVRLLDKNSGMVTIALKHGETTKRFSVRVDAAVEKDNSGDKLTMA